MIKTARIIILALIIAALALPAFSAGVPAAKKAKPSSESTLPGVVSTVASVPGMVYDTGSGLVGRTEGLVTGCLKNTFSFFNPCLDLVKGCTSALLVPVQKPIDFVIEKPADYIENLIASKKSEPSPPVKRAVRAPQPIKP
jgi:hypothetical protein